MVIRLTSFGQWVDITPENVLIYGSSGIMIDSLTLFAQGYDSMGAGYPCISRTIDGGKNWDIIARSSYKPVEIISNYIALSKDTFIYSTHLRNLYYSTDGGITILKFDSLPGGGPLNVSNKVFHTNNFTKDIFMLGNDYKMYKTSDFCKTWSEAFSKNLSFIHFINPLIGFAWGGNYEIQKTTDGGNNWFPIYTFEGKPYISKVLFTNENSGFYITQDEIFKSTDAGTTWKSKSVGLPPNVDIDWIPGMFFNDSLRGWLIVVGPGLNNYTIYRTNDGAESWHKLQYNDFNNSRFAHFTGTDTNNMVLWPQDNNRWIYRTTNGGGPYSDTKEKPFLISYHKYNIYPNPASQILTVRCESDVPCTGSMQLYSLQGLLILQKEIIANETVIDISALPNGFYMVKVVDKKGVWVSKVVME